MTLSHSRISRTIRSLLPNSRADGRKILLQDSGDFVRGVYLERSSTPESLYISVFADTLFFPDKDISLSCGFRLERSDGRKIWQFNGIDIAAEVESAIKLAAVPFFNSTTTLSGVKETIQEYLSENDPYRWYHVACCDAREGKVCGAIESWNKCQQLASGQTPWQKEVRSLSLALLESFYKGKEQGQLALNELVSRTKFLRKLN